MNKGVFVGLLYGCKKDCILWFCSVHKKNNWPDTLQGRKNAGCLYGIACFLLHCRVGQLNELSMGVTLLCAIIIENISNPIVSRAATTKAINRQNKTKPFVDKNFHLLFVMTKLENYKK